MHERESVIPENYKVFIGYAIRMSHGDLNAMAELLNSFAPNEEAPANFSQEQVNFFKKIGPVKAGVVMAAGAIFDELADDFDFDEKGYILPARYDLRREISNFSEWIGRYIVVGLTGNEADLQNLPKLFGEASMSFLNYKFLKENKTK